jgi:hypothetical protein
MTVKPKSPLMKNNLLVVLVLIAAFAGCAPSHRITGSWINHDALPKGPYKSIFIVAISQNNEANRVVEDLLAKRIESRGPKAVRSSDFFPINLTANKKVSKEQMDDAIRKSGCDAVFTLALLDIRTEYHYVPGTAYAPVNYGFYGSYYGYYNFYYPQVYSPGYYSQEKVYFVESNFYDIASGKLLWSVQSESYEPSGLKSWFNSYSYLLINHLKKEGLIKK